MTLTNKQFLENIYRKASERAESELERETVWAMADVNDVAEETIELTDELAEFVRKIARVSRMKLNLGVNREMHGKNEILENDGVETETCNHDCTFAHCGDGLTNVSAGEECDDGGESVTCDPDCTSPVCGDGYVNLTAGEVCDDGGAEESCSINCDSFLNGPQDPSNPTPPEPPSGGDGH